MPDRLSSDTSHDHRHKGGIRFWLEVLAELWSSDLNTGLVDLIDPDPASVLLDIGAGLGAGAFAASERLETPGTVVAIDPSRIMRVAMKARRAASSHRRKVEVAAGSAEAIPLPDTSVDAAWAVNAVHHFDDVREAVAEVARVLKTEGVFYIAEEHFDESIGFEPPEFDTDVLAEALGESGLTFELLELHEIRGTVADVWKVTKAK